MEDPMLKSAPLCLPLLFATPAFADTDVSAMIAADGLRATETALAALPAPAPSDRFALGGVRFLAALETALQTRWRTGLSGGLTTLVDLPVLRLPVPENPDPEPFQGAIIAALFAQMQTDLNGAAPLLAGIADGDDVAVTINTADIWFDIDMNGARSPGEGLSDLLTQNMGGFGQPLPDITVRFDTADAAWLAAYAHLLSGLADMVIAFDPATAIDDVLAARAQFAQINIDTGSPYGTGMGMMVGDYTDVAAMIVDALERQPDAALTRSAQAHWLAMVEQNRIFWARVAQETDNDAEWIPNKSQVSALGLPFPADTGQRWLNVLADAEAVLKGEALMPHWRIQGAAGIDLNALLQNPPTVDVLGMIHGMDLLPYIRPGRVITRDSWWRFEELVTGNAGLYMVILN
jgi:hypothetical protein